MAPLIFRPWVCRACLLPRRVLAGLLSASLALVGAAGCDDAFAPRPRPTGAHPDSVAPPAALLWYELRPRAVRPGGDSVRVTVAVQGTPDEVVLNTPGRFLPMTRVSGGVYTTSLTAAELLFDYRTGDLRNTASVVEITTNNVTEQVPLTVNVRDAAVPTVAVQSLAVDVQATSHVVNIRHDSLYAGGQVPPQVVRTFYQYFPDDYDFISVLAQVQSRHIYHYYAARNEVTGLGLQTFDRADNFGSPDQLNGILHFPNDALFDPAETSVIHELAHRWMNFSNLQNVRTARPHFPISTLAFGITGYSAPDSANVPNIFRYELTPQPDGTYAVRILAERPRSFNDFELYLLGLLPPDSVQPHVVFLNQNQRDQLRDGGVLAGPTDTVTIADWVARDGVRTPGYPATQRSFRMATIVLSRGRLLTPEELSFYHALALRGEAVAPLQSILGTTRFTTWPFLLATGGRGALVTRLRAMAGN